MIVDDCIIIVDDLNDCVYEFIATYLPIKLTDENEKKNSSSIYLELDHHPMCE